MRNAAFALLAATSISSAYAEITPAPGARDWRMRTVAYDPGNVVVIVGAEGRSTSIQLGEEVGPFALGDEKSWTVSTVGNSVFLSPNHDARNTNMQVVTKRPDGTTRVYQFDLVATADPAKAMAGVNFAYPEDVRLERLKAAQAAQQERQSQVAEDRLSVDAFMGTRNWKFAAMGDREIEPAEVSDNGRQTAFQFPGTQRFPAIYAGKCGPHNETVATGEVKDGGLIIVHSTSQDFCLRSGQRVLEIRNVGYDPLGVDPRTGTSSPEVTRVVRRPPPRWVRR
jgi:type IV secretion system protein VirB9